MDTTETTARAMTPPVLDTTRVIKALSAIRSERRLIAGVDLLANDYPKLIRKKASV